MATTEAILITVPPPRLTSVDYSDPLIFYPNFQAALRDRAEGRAYPS